MKRILFILTTFLVLPLSSYTQVKAFPIDSWHSNISFSVKFGGLLPIKGNFERFSGTILWDEQDILKTSAKVKIHASSINTGVKMRDDHLRNPDFFDVEKHPFLIFTSTKVYQQGEHFFMEGDLEMHGISNKETIRFNLVHGEKADPWKNARITFQAEGDINRLDYKVGEGQNNIAEIVHLELITTGRIFNTETNNLFKRPFGLRMVTAFESGGIESGRVELEKLTSEKDKDVTKLSNFRYLYLKLKQMGNLKASLQVAKLTAEQFPERAESKSLLGYSYFENGEMDEALSAFKDALILDEHETLAHEMIKWLENDNEGK
ncbi:MAG: YceI family protein [Bacteroidota bacterium]